MSNFNRMTALLLVWYEHMNPNGDPNLDNEPRSESYNGQIYGYQTDVCVKRMIRDSMLVLNTKDLLYHDKKTRIVDQNKSVAEKDGAGKAIEVNGKDSPNKKILADALLRHFIDIRLFGLCGVDGKEDKEPIDDADEEVAPKGKKSDKSSFIPEVRTGPVRVSYSQSLHPIQLEKDPIVRTTHSNLEGVSTFGKYDRIRAGLYKTTIVVNASQAAKTGCTEEDVEKMFVATAKMSQTIQSRGRRPCVTKLFVFKHSNFLGNVADEILTDLVLRNIKHKNNFSDVQSLNEFNLGDIDVDFVQWAIKTKQPQINGVTVKDYIAEAGLTPITKEHQPFPSIDEYRKQKSKNPAAAAG